jgi:AcrR family transcriptional regulator
VTAVKSRPGRWQDPGVARVKNQTLRRAELIEAASRALLDRGVAGLRLKDVAEQAGLTPGSVLYYYADVEELLTEVFGQGTRHYCDGREERVARAGGVRGRLRACIASGVPYPGEPAGASQVLYELMPVVVRHARGAALYGEFFDRQAALYEGVLADGARSGELCLTGDAADLARGFVALEDGFGILVLTGAETPESVERRLLEYARVVAGL